MYLFIYHGHFCLKVFIPRDSSAMVIPSFTNMDVTPATVDGRIEEISNTATMF